jgi:hypothetical protein
MSSQLKNFINDLLQHEHTRIQVNQDGISILNNPMNYHLKIFSDKFNGFYFEFNAKENNPLSFLTPSKNIPNPTYRTENFQECKLIFDELIFHVDQSKLNLNKNAPKYIDLFRKILKQESLPDGYNLTHNHDFIELFEEHTGFTLKMPQYFIKNVNKFLHEKQEPTSILKLHIYIQKDKMIDTNQHQSAIIVYVPRYSIKDYPLLNSYELALKNEEALTDSASTWFESLNNLKAIQSSSVSKLVEYYALSEGLEYNGSSTKKKPKL